jgi:hypothetical protein
MRQHFSTACVLACALLAGGCDENLSTLAGPTPDLDPTFASIQRDIFELTDAAGRRACASCHNAVGARFTGGLNLERALAYDQLVNAASTQRPDLRRVSPGNPDDSYLIRKLEGSSGIVGVRMPHNGPPYLTSGQIRIIRRWIELGAPRN